MKKKLVRFTERLLPSYAYIPLLLTAAANFLVYYGARLFNAGRVHYSMWSAVDDRIPFVSWFVVFYVLAYVQWIAGYILIGRESRAACMRFCFADILAKLLTLVCFLAVPTMIIRPEITGSSVFDRLTRLIYRADAADNLFPSLHCLESWICFRSALSLKKPPRWYRPVSLAFTLLVFASTVFLKQHVFVDIPGGVAAAEAGVALSHIIDWNSKYSETGGRKP